MPFVLKKDLGFDWPCTLEQPIGGKHEPVKVTCRFRQLSREELAAVLGRGEDEDEDEGEALDTADRQAALARQVLVGWGKEVVDEDGDPVEFTDSSRDAFLATPWVQRGVIVGYLASQAGKKAKRGN